MLVYYSVKYLLQKKGFKANRILDIGCGNGSTTHLLSSLLNPSQAIGLDLTTKQIQTASTTYRQQSKLNYLVADAESLPICENSIDLITNIESAHLYQDIEAFLLDSMRCLSPGGYFAFVDLIIPKKRQDKLINTLIKKNKNIQVVLKEDITKPVTNAVYERVVTNEKSFFVNILQTFNHDYEHTLKELPYHVINYGGSLLSRRDLKKLSPSLYQGVLEALKTSQITTGWRRRYVYYLLQKN